MLLANSQRRWRAWRGGRGHGSRAWHCGLRSGDASLHAASVEVLEAVLVGPSREALLAIIDEGVPLAWRVRAAAAALGIALRPLSHREAIDAMIAEGIAAESWSARYLPE